MTEHATRHPNIAVMEQVLAAFQTGDVDAMQRLFSPSIVWTVPGTSRLAGQYLGHQQLFDFFAALSALSDGTFTLHPEWMMANDDGVTLFHGTTARRGDAELDVDMLVHVRMRDGQVVEGTDYILQEHRWDAFWL